MVDYVVLSLDTHNKKLLSIPLLERPREASKAVRICGAKILGEKRSKGGDPSLSCTSQGNCQVQKQLLREKMLSRALDPGGFGDKHWI